MKQIVIISGKGGTGKTVLTGSFAFLAEKKVLADCDVDAADLHLLLQPKIKEKYDFKSGRSPVIDPDLCTKCGKCREVCRFEAITEDFTVDEIACEGCAFCSYVCPTEAIAMTENLVGEWYISETRFGVLVHAVLGIGQENSGKLVSLVRQKAKEIAISGNYDYVLIDGTPGIGCPVIASISGVDCAIVVTEPSLSGIHDAKRVIEVAQHFNVPVNMVINKFDLNLDITKKIEEYAKQNGICLLGKISFDKEVVKSVVNGRPLAEYSNCKAKQEITSIWKRLEEKLIEE